MTSINYPKLNFIAYKDIHEPSAINHIDKLMSFLKGYRGIKKELMSQYCNFHDFRTNIKHEDLVHVILNQISIHKKKND